MDNVRYVTSRGENVSLLKPPIIINTKQFREFLYETKNGKPLPATEKTFSVPAALVGTSSERETILEKMLYDSELKEYGKLYVNGWFVYCNFLGINSVVAESKMGARVDLSFFVPKLEWLKEKESQFFPNTDFENEGLNFPFNPPFNYGSVKRTVAQIENSNVTDADFIFEFTGSTESVDLGVGDISYKVESSVDSSEQFYLNTYTRKVYKTRDDNKIDLFSLADDDSYIFTKIPHGVHNVFWSGDYPIKITLLERRRFPPWI